MATHHHDMGAMRTSRRWCMGVADGGRGREGNDVPRSLIYSVGCDLDVAAVVLVMQCGPALLLI